MKYVVLLVIGFLWFLGCSSSTTQWLGEKRIIQDDYRYGDLYRFANLSAFRVPVEKCSFPSPLPQRPIQLVLFGDSFTEEGRIEKEHFVAEDFSRFFVANDGYVFLKKNKKNILIIETVERHFRERFAEEYTHVKINQKPPKENKTMLETLLDWQVPYATERHISALFSSDFIFTIKEWKAAFNQKLFHRIDENVTLSPDGQEIVYSLATKKGSHSIFDKVSDEEINQLVSRINLTYATYRKNGFDEVYLSIIPNKATIVASDFEEYNHLVERIQENKHLKMPIIDMYSPMKKGGKSLFDKGDTHWNCEGKQIWIDKINQILKVF